MSSATSTFPRTSEPRIRERMTPPDRRLASESRVPETTLTPAEQRMAGFVHQPPGLAEEIASPTARPVRAQARRPARARGSTGVSSRHHADERGWGHSGRPHLSCPSWVARAREHDARAEFQLDESIGTADAALRRLPC
jgi:hypothetical protein